MELIKKNERNFDNRTNIIFKFFLLEDSLIFVYHVCVELIEYYFNYPNNTQCGQVKLFGNTNPYLTWWNITLLKRQ